MTSLASIRTQRSRIAAPAGWGRRGYTILELMLSLALLAMLMTVAWSIMGSFRVAEQRGWDQAYRMQMIRVSRAWLETDVLHLTESVPKVGAGTPSPRVGAFRGDASGFQAEIMPSVDPLSWLEQVTSADRKLTSTTGEARRESASEPGVMDPRALHSLRYRLVATTAGGGETPIYELRRQVTPQQRWPASSESSAADRLLTAEDLYRSTDEVSASRGDAGGMRTERLRNLAAPQFRYTDGKEWVDQWDSIATGQLPRAIELSFDFPPATNPYQVFAPAAEEAGIDALDGDPSDTDREGVAGAIPVPLEEPLLTTTGAGTETVRDVRIVVLVPRGSPRQSGTNASPTDAGNIHSPSVAGPISPGAGSSTGLDEEPL